MTNAKFLVAQFPHIKKNCYHFIFSIQFQGCIDAFKEKLEKLLEAVFNYGQKSKFLGQIWSFFVK